MTSLTSRLNSSSASRVQTLTGKDLPDFFLRNGIAKDVLPIARREKSEPTSISNNISAKQRHFSHDSVRQGTQVGRMNQITLHISLSLFLSLSVCLTRVPSRPPDSRRNREITRTSKIVTARSNVWHFSSRVLTSRLWLANFIHDRAFIISVANFRSRNTHADIYIYTQHAITQ